jgi:hypothetical protein
MKSMAVASVSLLLLTSVAAHGQHSLGMHSHSGAGSASACADGRWDREISLDPQRGDLQHKVSTGNREAQDLFNQGLTFFYGFDSESAMRSFHQASVKDSNLAMAYWGVALAAGGDLNIPINDPCMLIARKQIELAKAHLASASREEKLYVNALAQRYATPIKPGSDIPIGDPQQLGVYYMLAMKSVYKDLGAADPDAGALYAYSLMNLRPWLWWTTSGQASAEIAEVVRVLDASLPRFPTHIGLHHIKIHALEEGPVKDAKLAQASAEFLFNNAPFITPHLRHMPAHTFLLLGDWSNVIQANLNAVAADQPWADKCGAPSALTCNQLLVGHYYSHDLLFLAVGYNNRGEWNEVERRSNQLEDNVRKFIGGQAGLEHYLTTKVAMMVHFGRWDELAKLSPPQKDMPDPEDPKFCAKLDFKLATAMWYFGRGMGRASVTPPLPTDEDVYGFQKAQSCVQNAGLGWGNNSASAILQIVRWRLLERIARMKDLKDASKELALLAVQTEDLLDYDEPPGWYLSSRETYGAALFLAGDFTLANTVFIQDQLRRPNNSRSLFGLWKVLEIIQPSEAATAKANFYRQWTSKDLPDMKNL